MLNVSKPGMVASTIRGFNRTHATVRATRDRKGNITGWQYECGGCQERKFFKVRDDHDAHLAASALTDTHRCPPQVRAAKAIHAIAKAS